MKQKLETNSLKSFTNKYINNNIVDSNNIRASKVLNNPSENNYFSIQKTYLARQLLKFPIEHHKVDFYELLIVKNGNNKRSVNLFEFILEDYSFSFTIPGQIVSDDLITNALDGYHIYFDNIYIQQIDKSLFDLNLFSNEQISKGVFSKKQFKFIESLLFRIEELFVKNINENLLKCYIKILLIELNSLMPSSNTYSQNKVNYLAHQFRIMLCKKPDFQLSIEFYADTLGINAKHLHKICMETFGYSPSELKNNVIIIEAKYLLLNTNNNVTEIANSIGFDDSAYFSRFFKKHTKKSPMGWKIENFGIQ
jgi:AraC family transcriptional regulator, transcriptional activator of pobA